MWVCWDRKYKNYVEDVLGLSVNNLYWPHLQESSLSQGQGNGQAQTRSKGREEVLRPSFHDDIAVGTLDLRALSWFRVSDHQLYTILTLRQTWLKARYILKNTLCGTNVQKKKSPSVTEHLVLIKKGWKNRNLYLYLYQVNAKHSWTAGVSTT